MRDGKLKSFAEQARLSRIAQRLEEAQEPGRPKRTLTPELLAGLVGDTHAVYLMTEFAGSTIPKVKPYLRIQRRKAIIRDFERGWDVGTLAMRYKLSPLTITDIVQPPNRQPRKRKRPNAAGIQSLTAAPAVPSEEEPT